MTWYDLDRIPLKHRPLFERAKAAIDEARRRSAHERCRRFESADLSISTDDALRHVEGRAEDLSQTRPEYGHATNALCFVGRRDWSRGLFLDRRAFLTSYDPTQDDDRSSILERLLQAVIPVCAGINLEYYFSYVDPTGYGCGTKLPHNITSLLGVMDGAASDLRPGLPWQMVEIHEPVRLLFVIETTPEAMRRIIDENEAIARLVNGNWVQLAVLDAEANRIRRYVDGEFVDYEPKSQRIARGRFLDRLVPRSPRTPRFCVDCQRHVERPRDARNSSLRAGRYRRRESGRAAGDVWRDRAVGSSAE